GALLIVKRPLLRIDQRVIGEREQCELARGFLGTSIDVWMPFAGQLAIGGFDLSSGCRWLNAQDLIVIGHRKGIVSGRYATSAYAPILSSTELSGRTNNAAHLAERSMNSTNVRTATPVGPFER